MNWRDRVWVSVRHIRGRLVESILVVAATAVGVALVAAMVAFIKSYDEQTEYLLSHPAYRELLAEVVGNESELTEPAVPYDATTTRDIRLGMDDVSIALESAPAVEYGYLADYESLSTQLPWERGGGPGGGIPPGTSTTATDGATTGSTTVSDAAQADASATDSSTAPGNAGGFDFFGGPPSNATGDGTAAATDGTSADNGASQAGPGDNRRFDFSQFLNTDPDVVTDLPLDEFAGISATADFFQAYSLDAASGSLFTEDDVDRGNQVIVLGSELATKLFPDGDAIGTKIRLNLQTYTVIGVLAPTGLEDVDTGTSYNNLAYVPNTEGQTSFGGTFMRFQRPTRTLRFAVADSAMIAAAADQLQAHFDSLYGDGVIRITAPINEVTSQRSQLGRILGVVLFLAAAGLFIASINLFNLMLMRVIKRTKGVGITRAIGASRREVFRSFLNEATMMSLTGAAIGLAASPFVYELLRRSLIAEVSSVNVINWGYLLIGAVAAFLFSLLFGVWPARQAARIDASLAIRTE